MQEKKKQMKTFCFTHVASKLLLESMELYKDSHSGRSVPSMNLSSFLSNNLLAHQRPEISCGDMREIFYLFQSVVVTRAGDLDCVYRWAVGLFACCWFVSVRWDWRQIPCPDATKAFVHSSAVRVGGRSLLDQFMKLWMEGQTVIIFCLLSLCH